MYVCLPLLGNGYKNKVVILWRYAVKYLNTDRKIPFSYVIKISSLIL